MPTGPGFAYELDENGNFSWRCLLEQKQWSMEACEYINYLQGLHPFTTGESVHIIRYALNGGEIEINLAGKKFIPDGYCEISGKKIVIFFDGCRYHFCKHNCKASQKGLGDKNRDTSRDKIFADHGYKVIQMNSCQWAKVSKNLKFKNYASVFFNEKKPIEPATLWAKIKSGAIFGVIKCDVECPQHVVDFFLKFNFPPIFVHKAIDEDMIGSKMHEFCKNLKFPTQPQLTTVFNQKDHLLSTPMALFLMNKGVELSNLTLVIEYQKDRPFRDFIEDCTNKRIEATKNKDVQLANTNKLKANR